MQVLYLKSPEFFLTHWFSFKILNIFTISLFKILNIFTISLFKMFTYQYNFLIFTIQKHMFYFLFTFTTYTDTAHYLIISKASEETAQSVICICPKYV